jgi:hypothetical protein
VNAPQMQEAARQGGPGTASSGNIVDRHADVLQAHLDNGAGFVSFDANSAPLKHDGRPNGSFNDDIHTNLTTLRRAAESKFCAGVGISCAHPTNPYLIVDVDVKGPSDASGHRAPILNAQAVTWVRDVLAKVCPLSDTYGESTPSTGTHHIFSMPLGWVHSSGKKKTVVKFDDGSAVEFFFFTGYVRVFPTVNFERINDHAPLVLDADEMAAICAVIDFESGPSPVAPRRLASDTPGQHETSDHVRNVVGVPNLMVEAGWTITATRGADVFFRHADTKNRVSAIYHGESGQTKVFSTSTVLPTEGTVSPLGMYAYLRCGGDFVRAGKEIRALIGPSTGNSFDGIFSNREPVDFSAMAGQSSGTNDAQVQALRNGTMTADSLRELPRPEWIVAGLIQRWSVGVLWGASGTYKTFLSLDLALRLCAGLQVWGFKSQQRNVGYLFGEGGASIALRVEAWRIANPGADISGFRLIGETPPLAELGSTWARSITTWANEESLELLIIDTTARAFGDADESKTPDMNRFVASLGYIAKHVGGVLAVHHAGIEQGRMRGSTALYSACDYVLAVKRADKGRTVTLTNAKPAGGKSKDSEELETPLAFKLRIVELDGDKWGTDERPNPTSLVADHVTGSVGGIGDGPVDRTDYELVERVRAHLEWCEAYAPDSGLSSNSIETSIVGASNSRIRGALDDGLRLGRFTLYEGPLKGRTKGKYHYLSDDQRT